jgi:hypothetical protein
VAHKLEAFERIADERMGTLERTLQEQLVALSSAMTSSIEGNVERLTAAAGAMDGMDSALAESQSAVADRLMAHVGEAQETLEERMRTHVDDRMAAIAKLIRSDNQVLAERFAALTASTAAAPEEPADAELMRQVLRAVKELEAGLASDMLGTMDRRFQTVADQLHKETQSTAEAMVKIAEILGEKIDRLTVRVDEGVGGEMQVVVDRMSDAIQALSSSQRRQSA